MSQYEFTRGKGTRASDFFRALLSCFLLFSWAFTSGSCVNARGPKCHKWDHCLARRRRLLLIHLWMLPSMAEARLYPPKAHNVSRLVLSGGLHHWGYGKGPAEQTCPLRCAAGHQHSAICMANPSPALGHMVRLMAAMASASSNDNSQGCRLTYFDRYFVCPGQKWRWCTLVIR